MCSMAQDVRPDDDRDPDGMVNISIRQDRELKKKVLVPGNYLDIPREAARVQVKISEVMFRNENGECEVDEHSRYFRNDFNGNVIVGDGDCFIDMDFDRCLQRMSCGETSILTMEYRNAEGKIMKHVSCRVELIEVSDEDLVSDWGREKLLTKAYHHKERGVQLVRARRVADAFRCFSKAFKFLSSMEPFDHDYPAESLREMVELKLKLLNNLAHCQLHYGRHAAALDICEKLLFLDFCNVKGLYRRGMARMGLQDWEGAHRDMSTVVRYEPHNREAIEKLNLLTPKVAKINEDYNSMVRKMFA